MKPRILLISTDKRTAEIAKELSVMLNIPLSIHVGGILRNGHLYALEVEDEYDVIISMGGTAAVLKKLVSIPVVTIHISTIDFLKAMVEAKKYGNTIALVSHRDERLDGIEGLKDIIDIDFKVFPYSNREELRKQMADAIEVERLTVVSMGSCVLETAREKNIKGVLIKSSRTAIEQAIITAKEISDYAKDEKEKAQRLNAIIDYSSEGIIILNQNKYVTILNPAAEKMLDIKAKHVTGKEILHRNQYHSLKAIYEDGSHVIGKLIKVNNTKVILNRVPIEVNRERLGMVITLQEVTKLQELEKKVRSQLYRKGLVAKYTAADIIGESPAIKKAIEWMKKFAGTTSTILLEGETGSGKELFAQSIHNISERRDGPFVAINCAALPENLLESELFGYEEGAFTGAKKGGKPGLFELAHGGTIFLDEVGEIPLGLQSRLLRVLQEREVLRIGGDYILNVDIRVIAATNIDLYKLVKEGKFRKDLFFRLNILNLKIPSLRERVEDIPLLLKEYIRVMNIKHKREVEGISRDGMRLLKKYPWPGNVRELINFVERMVILSEEPIIDRHLIEQLLMGHGSHENMVSKAELGNGETVTVKVGTLKEMELEIIEKLSKRFKLDKIEMAEKLGISRTTLWKKLKEREKRNNP